VLHIWSTGKGSGYNYNCNNVPKRTKLNAERQRDYRKCNAEENKTSQASTSTDQTPTPIIHNYNQANEYFQRILLVTRLVMPATYVIDYSI
jgi:fumarate hydratase class II